MTRQVRSFGFYLRQFARSIDIVDERTIEDVRKLVYDYVRDELQIGFFTVAVKQGMGADTTLQSRWRTDGAPVSTTAVRTADGGYGAQTSVAFDTGKPLWIVDPEQGPLVAAQTYCELWSDLADLLPRYRAPINRQMRTSIIVPLVHWGEVLGVIYLESSRYLEFTEVASEELLLLADTLAVLFDLRDANESQLTGTRDAVAELRDVLAETTFPRITRPQIFIGSSGRADDEVMGTFQVVLKEFEDALTVVHWDRIDSSGSITQHIIEAICRSRFGLCYLSEPARPGAGTAFQDNPTSSSRPACCTP